MSSGQLALTLVQNWMCKNEVKDVKVTKISKNHHIKRTSIQIHSNKFYSKNDNILLVIEFKRNSEFFVSKFIEKISDSISGSNCMDGI